MQQAHILEKIDRTFVWIFSTRQQYDA